MGSFPFGLIATWIGAPWTVAICGALTFSLVGYVVSYRASLRDAKSVGELSRRATAIAPPAQ